MFYKCHVFWRYWVENYSLFNKVLITKTGTEGVKFQKHNEYLLCMVRTEAEIGNIHY